MPSISINPQPGLIQVDHLTYTYPGADKRFFRGSVLRLKRARFSASLGHRGAGKSTTQKVLNGLLRGYQGTVRVNGTDLAQVERSFL